MSVPQLSLAPRSPLTGAWSRHRARTLVPLLAFHLAALATLVWSETGLDGMAIFIAVWGLLNFFWLSLLRRPGISAALSLLMLAILIVISRFKFGVVSMSATFVDVMIIDSDTFAFLWMMFPNVRVATAVAVGVFIPVVYVLWRIDTFRVHRAVSMAGAAACLAAIVVLGNATRVQHGDSFGNENYASYFARSAVEAIATYWDVGYLESDKEAVDRLKKDTVGDCQPTEKPPHIIMVHDEGSFDLRAVEDVKVPQGYGKHFRSFDGRARRMLVEGAGGPSWVTEYNVLSGLSSRSYGRFQFFVTRIAAGRVERGLPRALQRCGYRTHAIYPVNGGFLGASSYYKGVGIADFVDGKALGGDVFEPDRFYFDAALRMIERERRQGPMFLYVYLTANHFTWDYQFHPELTPAGWRDPCNTIPEVNEYLRRQAMSEGDYAGFLAGLKRNFPGEEFLIVRYGDHQPDFAK